VVTFSGSIGNHLYLTLDHGGGLITTYSWVSALLVGKSGRVMAGQPIARSGSGHPGDPIPNLHFDGYCVFTNRVPTSAMRGFGVTSVSFAVETHMSRVADLLGLDPLEIRLKNANRIGDTSPNGVVYTDPSTVLTMDSTARPPYAQDWNFAVQRAFRKDYLLEVRYVGTKGTRLPRFIEGNPSIYVPGPDAASNIDRRRIYAGCDGATGPCDLASVGLISGSTNSTYHALQTTVSNLQETLKDGSRSGAADFAGRNVRRGLVVAEMALSLTLLIGAGLLIKSVGKLQGVDPGFDPRNVLTFNLALPAVKYPTDTASILFMNQLMPRLNSLTGVQAAAVTSVIPFGGGWSTSSFTIEGVVIPPGQNGPWGDIRIVSPKFFEAMRIPLKKGRVFSDQDIQNSPTVTVIDEQFVKKYFANTDPIGKRITRGARRGSTDSSWITIIGVVGHAAHEGLDAEPRIQYYFPVSQSGGRFFSVVMRTAAQPSESARPLSPPATESHVVAPVWKFRAGEHEIAGGRPDRLALAIAAQFGGGTAGKRAQENLGDVGAVFAPY
jgi:hypothetical protein